MGISTDNDRLTIIISKDLKQSLKELAIDDNRSLSNFVVTILEDFVTNISDNKNDSN